MVVELNKALLNGIIEVTMGTGEKKICTLSNSVIPSGKMLIRDCAVRISEYIDVFDVTKGSWFSLNQREVVSWKDALIEQELN